MKQYPAIDVRTDAADLLLAILIEPLAEVVGYLGIELGPGASFDFCHCNLMR